MDKVLKYSVLRYSPSTIAGEMINLGILFFEEDLDYREFRYSKKFSRLSSFDDEINIELVKKLLQSIKFEVERTVLNYGRFCIESFTEYYINDYCFEKPKMIKYDDLHESIEMLNKAYFRFDYDKAERPSTADDRKLIEQIMDAQGKKYKKNKSVSGRFNDNIVFDIVSDDYNIKLFDFNEKQLSKLINVIKAWAWNCKYSGVVNPIIMYRYDEDEKKPEFATIMEILKAVDARVFDIEGGMQFIQKTN